MPDDTPRARKWTENGWWMKWWEQTRRWHDEKPLTAKVSIEPSKATAFEPNTWRINFSPVGFRLTRGAHLAIEVPGNWETDMGTPFRRRIANQHLILPSEGHPGYGSYVTVSCSREDVELDIAVSNSAYIYMVDVAVVEGEIGEGDSITVTLGAEDGSKFRCHKLAQVSLFTLGVDIDGSGVYREVTPKATVKVVGAHATKLKVIAPSTPLLGESWHLTVLAVDGYNENPASGYAGDVSLRSSPAGIFGPVEWSFDPTKPAMVHIPNYRAQKSGVYRIHAYDRRMGLAGRSNPICPGFAGEERIFFGDIHVQNYLSMGTGSIDEHYQWARDVESLDFCSIAGHHEGRYRFKITPEHWDFIVKKTNHYNQPGRFVTFVGYEWAAGGYGHMNVYYRGHSGPVYPGNHPEANTPEKLWEKLEKQGALTIPHHSKYLGRHNWSPRNDAMMRLVEICSGWGISEEGGEHSVQRALELGHRLGFIGGSDHHFAQPGHGWHYVNEGAGLAAVFAKQLSREAIWDALYARRCYATTGQRILLDFRINDHPMGEQLPASSEPRRIHIRAIGTNRIEKVEILRNNRVIHSVEPRAELVDFEFEDMEPIERLFIEPTYPTDCPFVFYYCRLRQYDRAMAWSSPIWFEKR